MTSLASPTRTSRSHGQTGEGIGSRRCAGQSAERNCPRERNAQWRLLVRWRRIPEAILYDEPTTMVDPIMVGHMSDLISKLKGKFHAHVNRRNARYALGGKLAEQIVFLQEGRRRIFFLGRV